LAKSEIIKKENCRVVLKVEIPVDEVKAEFEKVYKGLTQHASVPGFRKGHVPLTIIKTRYAELAKEEVLQHLISSSFQDAIKEKNLEVLTEPSVEEAQLKPEEPLTYKAIFDVRPEIKLGDYNKAKLTKKIKKITEKDLDASLKDIQERFAQYITVEKKELELKDYALVDIKITEGEKETLNREGVTIYIDDAGFGKGFGEKVTGLKKEEEREFTLKVPAKEGDKEIEKEMKFRIKLREIKEKRLSPVDDELAKDVGLDNLEKLKEDLKKRLEAFEEEKTHRELTGQIDEHILSIGEVSPPASVIKKREEFLLKEMQQSFEQQGKKDEYKAKEEELKKVAREGSLRRVKLAYLLDEIGRRENIKVNEEEIEADLKTMFGENKEGLKNARERLRKEHAWENYALRIRERKIYQHIMDKAEIIKKEE